MSVTHRHLPHLVALVCVVFFSACSQVAPSNPFDPKTPAAQQAKSRITGKAVLPDGFAAATLAEGHAWLYSLSAPLEVAFEGDLVPDEPNEDGILRGSFTLDSVPADVYRLEVWVPGASSEPVLLNVPIGATVDVGEMYLDAGGGGFITGTALREGEGIESQAGIVVSVPGTSFTTLTNDEGAFRLEVSPGEHVVRASDPGYLPVSTESPVQITRHQTLALDTPLLLVGQPGTLNGRVVLPRAYATAERLGSVVIDLRPRAGGDAVAVQPASADGRFVFDGLAAGAYTLVISLASFEAHERDLELPVGGRIEIGTIELVPALFGRVTGVARLVSALSHEGIQVSVEGDPAVSLTTADGSFVIETLAGPRTLHFSARGYASATTPVPVEVAANDTVNILDDILLSGEPGIVRGRLRLPSDFERAALLASAEVVLTPPDGGQGLHRAAVGASGEFVLDGIGAGEYSLGATTTGFNAGERRVVVGPGADVDVGDVMLQPSELVRVLGCARLEGAVEHADIVVEVRNAGVRVFTDLFGKFAFDVPEGQWDVTFHHPGYSVTTFAGLIVERSADGSPVQFAGPVILPGLPGSIIGTVGLADGFAPGNRLASVVVRLERSAADGGMPMEVALTNATIEGEYLFDDIPAGVYRVTARLDGFAATPLLTIVDHDRQTANAPVLLAPTPNQASVRGRAELFGAADHGGIRVDAVGNPGGVFTDLDGSYALDVPAGERLRATLRFTAPGYASATLDLDEVTPPDRIFNVVDVPSLVGQPGRLRGLVRLDDRIVDRSLIQSVDVRVERIEEGIQSLVAQTVPSAEGVFAFDALGAGTYYVFARLANFVGDVQTATLSPGEQIDLPILSISRNDENQRGSIAGRVVREGRAGNENGGIRVEDLALGYVALTNSVGEFEMGVAGDRDYTLRFVAEGYSTPNLGPTRVRSGQIQRLREVVVMTAEPGRVRGHVVVPDGFDDAFVLASANVTLHRGDGVEVGAGRPSAQGDFLFAGISVGAYEVRILRSGFEDISLAIEVKPASTSELGDLLLVLRPAADRPTLAGSVLRAGQAANALAGTVLRLPGTPFEGLTSANGSFVIPAVEGTVAVEATYARYVPGVSGPIAVPALGRIALPQPLVLLAEPGRIRGLVRLPAGVAGEVMARVVVRLDRGPVNEGQLAPAGDGSFVFSSVTPGSLTVTVTLPDFIGDSRPVTVDPASTTDLGVLSVTLPEVLPVVAVGSASLQGIVDANGHGGIRVESSEYGLTTLTSSAGTFRMNLPRGRNTLVFYRDAYGSASRVFDIANDAEGDVAVPGPNVLSALPGAISGSVSLTRFGTPDRVRAATVEVLGIGNARLAQGAPAADGRFVIGNLASGNVTVRVTATGFEVITRPVVVPVGGAVELGDFALIHQSEGPSAVVFGGRVLLAGSGEHAGTTVRVRIGAPDLAYTQVPTDGDGRFEFNIARDEVYRVSVHRDGFVDPVLNTNWRWDAIDRRVENEVSAVFNLSLVRSPLNGRVEVPVSISPDWIPQDQQYVSVRLRGATLDQNVAQVTEANRAIFNNVPAGDYTIVVERAGFTSVQIPLTIDHLRPTAILQAVAVTLVNLAAAQLDLSGRTLAACDLRRAPVVFAGADLSGATFTGDYSAAGGAACAACVMCGAFDFDDTNLTSADFSQASSLAGVAFRRADLFGTNLSGRNLRGALFNAANLFGARAGGADLSGSVLDGANLASAQLAGARFIGLAEARPSVPCGVVPRPAVSLVGTSFAQADLTNALMSGTQLRGTIFTGARMRGTQLDWACLEDAVLSLNDLTGANLDRADASRAQFTTAILTKTRLRGAELDYASLVSAVIEEADFRGGPGANNAACDPYPFTDDLNDYAALCEGARAFTDARCCRTNLRESNLNGANLIGARFDTADLAGASLLGVNIGDGDGLPTEQPLDCDPELYSDCLDACNALNTCGLSVALNRGVTFVCEEWVATCVRGWVDLGPHSRDEEIDGQSLAGCLASAYTAGAGDCGAFALPGSGFFDCIEGAPYVPRAAPCTFAKIVDPVANGECDRERIPEYCLHAPTSFASSRLDGTQMTAITVGRGVFSNARARNAFLRGAFLVDVKVDGFDLDGSDLGQSTLANTNLNGVGLRNVNLTTADFFEASMHEADLTGANLERADLRRVLLRGATADEPDENSDRLEAVEADFTGAVMDGSSLPGMLAANAKFVDASLVDVSLRHASLIDADFTGATVGCLDLDHADLTRAQMPDLGFDWIQARDADFGSANLRGSVIFKGDLTNARFHSKPDLTGATLGRNGVCARMNLPQDHESCGGAVVVGIDAPPECTKFNGAYFDGPTLAQTVFEGDFTDATLRSLFLTTVGDQLTGHFAGAGFYNLQVQGPIPVGNSDFSGACFAGLDVQYADFGGAIFDGARRDPLFPPCVRACTELDGTVTLKCLRILNDSRVAADPPYARFQDTELNRTSFVDASLPEIEFTRVTMSDANLTRANLTNAAFNTATMHRLNVTDTDLDGATFNDVDFYPEDGVTTTMIRPSMRGARFSRGDAVNVNFRGADLNGAQFDQWCGGNASFTTDGVRRADLTNVIFRQPDLGSVGGDLSFSDFVGTTMPGVDFRGMYMNSAVIDGATATSAFFTDTSITGATIRATNLTGADLRRACGFQAASWNTVNFTNAKMCSADYTWITAAVAGRCTGCIFTGVIREACAVPCIAPVRPAYCSP